MLVCITNDLEVEFPPSPFMNAMARMTTCPTRSSVRAYPGPSRFMLVLLASLKAGFSPSTDLELGLEDWTAVRMTSTGWSVERGAGDLVVLGGGGRYRTAGRGGGW